jgi:hypothetical protein
VNANELGVLCCYHLFNMLVVYHGCDHKSVLGANPNDEQILARNRILKWAAFGNVMEILRRFACLILQLCTLYKLCIVMIILCNSFCTVDKSQLHIFYEELTKIH